jgi:hypothetical protein
MPYTCKVDIRLPHNGQLCINGTMNCTVHPPRPTKK